MRETKRKELFNISKNWTLEELNILKSNYPYVSNKQMICLIPNKSKDQIAHKASELKIAKFNHTWTKEDIELLRCNYDKFSTQELKEKFFPYRTESSIVTKANKLKFKSRLAWTKEENDILFEYYEYKANKFIKNNFMPNRTCSAITCQAVNLGLSKKITNIQYEKEDLLELLENFINEIGRVPTTDEINANKNIPGASTYHRYFGSYGKALSILGFEKNPVDCFGRIMSHFASDGTHCLSLSELQITEWLIRNKVFFRKEIPYSEICTDYRAGTMRSDWILEDGTIIEFFGMPGKKKYDEKIELKIQICKDNNLKLISLYRKDLRILDTVLQTLTNKQS